MQENEDEKVLDYLYEVREGDVEKQYIAKYGETKQNERTEKAENELLDFMKKFIEDEKDMQELYDKLNKFELSAMAEMCFWYKPYYKKGITDGISLIEQIKEEKITTNISSNNSLFDKVCEITDYIEEQKYNRLKVKKEYKEIIKKLNNLKIKYPKVCALFEDEKIAEFTQEETKAIVDMIGLYRDLSTLEADEMFKIGLKEGREL